MDLSYSKKEKHYNTMYRRTKSTKTEICIELVKHSERQKCTKFRATKAYSYIELKECQVLCMFNCFLLG